MLSLNHWLLVDTSAGFVPESPARSAQLDKLLRPHPHRPAADPSIDHSLGSTTLWAPIPSPRLRATKSAIILFALAYAGYGLGVAFGLI